LLNKIKGKKELEKTFEELQKSDKRFKLAIIIIFFIISVAIGMIVLSIVSSL